MARDATARLYDVDANSIVLDKNKATITFRARQGRFVALDQLHESIKATRLGDGTGMALRWLDVKAKGKIVPGKEIRLEIPGSEDYFLLQEDPNAPTPAEKMAFQRLRTALEKGETIVSVTGRVDGWQGNLTQFSKKLPDKPRRILVKDFETAKK